MSQRRYKCSFCGDTEKSNFYPSKHTRCAPCHNKDMNRRNRENKQYIIDHMGGKCKECGYAKCNQALDIHHLDPSMKDPDFKNMTAWSRERAVKEVEGCVLLCANCHREVHANQGLDSGSQRALDA